MAVGAWTMLTLMTTIGSLMLLSVPRAPAVTLGVDVLMSDAIDLLEGKRVGLVTNASGVDGKLVPTADRLAADPRVQLVQLWAPEHGLRGALAAGEKIGDSVDPATGLPVAGLWGKRRRPARAQLSRIDVIVFDIQDIGSRTYTYISTLGEVMKGACGAGVPVVVLDRPNPLGGLSVEGPVRETAHKSMIGWGPLPVTHGMTVGELARLYNVEMQIGCDLTVVPMKGWQRWMTWRDTGLHWVPTSPGIPHARHAQLYVATGMFGGIARNVNEGVGTTQPFEMIAAEFIDPRKLLAAVEAAKLPGVRFRPVTYRPYYHRFRRKILRGVQLIVTDSHRFRPLRTALTLLTTVQRLYPRQLRFRDARTVARVWGTREVLKAIRAGRDVASLEASWAEDLEAFSTIRARYLMYPAAAELRGPE